MNKIQLYSQLINSYGATKIILVVILSKRKFVLVSERASVLRCFAVCAVEGVLWWAIYHLFDSSYMEFEDLFSLAKEYLIRPTAEFLASPE